MKQFLKEAADFILATIGVLLYYPLAIMATCLAVVALSILRIYRYLSPLRKEQDATDIDENFEELIRILL